MRAGIQLLATTFVFGICSAFGAFASLMPAAVAQQGAPAAEAQEKGDAAATKKQVEAARRTLAEALKVTKYGERQEAILDAAKAFDACLELPFDDEIARNRVMREAGSAYFELAKCDWPFHRWNGPGKGDQGPWRPEEARNHYALARERFSKAAEFWVAKIGRLPKDPEEAQKRVAAATVGFVELGAAESDGARCALGLASSLPADDPRRAGLAKDAIDELKRVLDAYPNLMLGLYAGAQAANAHFALGDYEEAVEVNRKVLAASDDVVSGSPRFIEDFRARVGHQLMICWNHPKVAQPEKAIALGEAWMNLDADHQRTKESWEPAIRSHLARA